MIRNVRLLTYSSYASMFFLGVSIAVIGAAARNAGLAPARIGLLISAQHLGFVIAVILAGLAADRFAKPRILMTGSLILAFAFLTFYSTESFRANLAIMFCAGAGSGVYEGVTDAMLFDLHEKNQSRYVGINHFFVTFGSAGITAYLIFLKMNWRASLIQAGVAVLALAAFFAFAKLEKPSRPEKTASFDWSFVRRGKVLAMIFIACALAVGIELGATGFLTTFLMEERNFTQTASKLGLVMFFGGIAAGRLFLGLRQKNESVPKNILALFTFSFFLFTALFYLDLGRAEWLLIFLAGASVSALGPLMIALGGLAYPNSAGTAMGVVKTAIPVGGMLIPFTMSMISGKAGLQASLIVFPAAALIGFAIIFTQKYFLGAFKNIKGN